MKATSIEAFNNMKPNIPTDHKLILSVLNDVPATYKEIGYKVYKKLLLSDRFNTQKKAYAWKYDPNKVSRRMIELVRLEKAKIDGVRICTLAKSKCSTYIKL